MSTKEVKHQARKPSDSRIAEQHQQHEIPDSFLEGWRLHVLNISLCLGLFLSALDTSVVSTSITAITNDLQEFSRASWIVSAYLLSYNSFIVPLSKLSDVYGRRPLLAISTIIFIAFSAGAGWSQNMTQLCISRAFQGIGGGGLYGLTFVILPEMVAPRKYPLYSAILSGLFALSSLLGPLIGGAIAKSNNGGWRWIFWLNIPAGAVALALSWVALPPKFPYHEKPHMRPPRIIKRFDVLGAFLILTASVLVVAGLETGGLEFGWSSAMPIALLCVGCFCAMIFVCWEWYLERRDTQQEAVLPWRVLSDRFALGTLLYIFFSGAAFIAAVIQLPQRFQIVDGADSLTAGYRLLALTLSNPIGTGLAGCLVTRIYVPAIYVMVLGTVLQVLGLGLYAGLDADVIGRLPPEQYAFMVIMGIGFGISLSVGIMVSPMIFQPRDRAVGLGGISQFRVLGGSVGVSACASIMNHRITTNLTNRIDAAALAELQRSTAALDALPASVMQAFRSSYAQGVKEETYMIVTLSAASILATLLMIEKRPRRMQKPK